MNYTKTKTPDSTITRDPNVLDDLTGNIYLSVLVASRRADQISIEIKEELTQKLESFAAYTDNLEEISENTEQIEISKHYETLPKPTILAIEELLSGNTYWRLPRKYKKQKRYKQ